NVNYIATVIDPGRRRGAIGSRGERQASHRRCRSSGKGALPSGPSQDVENGGIAQAFNEGDLGSILGKNGCSNDLASRGGGDVIGKQDRRSRAAQRRGAARGKVNRGNQVRAAVGGTHRCQFKNDAIIPTIGRSGWVKGKFR